MFGISGGEFLVILLVIMVVIGPSRLPEYTRTFAQFVRKARVSLEGAKASVREELGPELSDLKLADFDPRNYDPRKIVRDVMGEDLEAIKRDLSNPLEALKETVTDTVSVADDVATSGRDALQSQPGQAPLAEPTDTNDTAGVNADQASAADTDAPEAGDSGNFDDTAYINPPDSVTSAQVDTDNSASLVSPTLDDQSLDAEPSNADSDAATNAEAPADTAPTAAAVDAAAANIALAPLSDADAALLAQLRSQVELSPRDILRAANAAKRPAPAAAGVEL
ncbi:MAG: twin-arginine translocase TatA/TatE family subunit [Actinomyces graevenitzii]|nr:twin-arginine translocase TatA/TatE family subunit [Actinomyces graevenitzii]